MFSFRKWTKLRNCRYNYKFTNVTCSPRTNYNFQLKMKRMGLVLFTTCQSTAGLILILTWNSTLMDSTCSSKSLIMQWKRCSMFEIFHSAHDKSHLMILDITLIAILSSEPQSSREFYEQSQVSPNIACMQDVTVAATHKQVLIGGAWFSAVTGSCRARGAAPVASLAATGDWLEAGLIAIAVRKVSRCVGHGMGARGPRGARSIKQYLTIRRKLNCSVPVFIYFFVSFLSLKSY